MDEKRLTETIWERAYKDSERCLNFLWFWLFGAFWTLASGIGGVVMTPDGATFRAQALIGVFAAFIGVVLLLGMTFLGALLLAPYRQRNEMRAFIKSVPGSPDEPITSRPQLHLGLVDAGIVIDDNTAYGFPKGAQGRIGALHILAATDDRLDLERVRIEVAGERYEAIGWKTETIEESAATRAYFPVDGVPPGMHEVWVEGYAEGHWWRSRKAYPIVFPKR